MKNLITTLAFCAIVAQGTGCASYGKDRASTDVADTAESRCIDSEGKPEFRNHFLRERRIPETPCTVDPMREGRYAEGETSDRDVTSTDRNAFLRTRRVGV